MSDRRRRGGGRAARQAQRATADLAFNTHVHRSLPPVNVLDDEGLSQIESNAETILSEVGVAFQEFPRALELWRDAGAEVDGDMVRFPAGHVP